jgi:hypothetical protein
MLEKKRDVRCNIFSSFLPRINKVNTVFIRKKAAFVNPTATGPGFPAR